MAPFKILGLDRKADIPQIKRAYAGLLRKHRPDVDPEGFQRLHEAYEACLQQARWREDGWDDDHEDAGDDGAVAIAQADPPADAAVVDPAPAAASAEAHEAAEGMPPEDALDTSAFADALMARMHSDSAQGLDAWLRSHDDLYALDHKRVLQWTVVDALESVEPAIAARHFETLTQFFGLDSIAGVDGWLQHRLYDVQRRFGDAAEFERVLRTHAGANASWTDQAIAKELLQPFSWLRRACLIACPGLPGRTGALARALRAADPESASTRLEQGARRFWERATDRNALRRERFAFIAIRLATWTALISGYIAAIDEGQGFPLDWGTSFGGFFVLWLAYALVVLGLLRFRDFNQSRLQWDMFLLMTAGGLACGVVSASLGGSGAMPFVVTALFWLGGRHAGGEGWGTNQFAALLAGLSGFGLAFLVMHRFYGDSVPLRYLGCAAVVFAFVSQWLHDLAFARVHGIPVHAARRQAGWLWPMLGVQAGLMLLFAALVK